MLVAESIRDKSTFSSLKLVQIYFNSSLADFKHDLENLASGIHQDRYGNVLSLRGEQISILEDFKTQDVELEVFFHRTSKIFTYASMGFVGNCDMQPSRNKRYGVDDPSNYHQVCHKHAFQSLLESYRSNRVLCPCSKL